MMATFRFQPSHAGPAGGWRKTNLRGELAVGQPPVLHQGGQYLAIDQVEAIVLGGRRFCRSRSYHRISSRTPAHSPSEAALDKPRGQQCESIMQGSGSLINDPFETSYPRERRRWHHRSAQRVGQFLLVPPQFSVTVLNLASRCCSSNGRFSLQVNIEPTGAPPLQTSFQNVSGREALDGGNHE